MQLQLQLPLGAGDHSSLALVGQRRDLPGLVGPLTYQDTNGRYCLLLRWNPFALRPLFAFHSGEISVGY